MGDRMLASHTASRCAAAAFFMLGLGWSTPARADEHSAEERHAEAKRAAQSERLAGGVALTVIGPVSMAAGGLLFLGGAIANSNDGDGGADTHRGDFGQAAGFGLVFVGIGALATGVVLLATPADPKPTRSVVVLDGWLRTPTSRETTTTALVMPRAMTVPLFDVAF